MQNQKKKLETVISTKLLLIIFTFYLQSSQVSSETVETSVSSADVYKVLCIKTMVLLLYDFILKSTHCCSVHDKD